MYFEGASEKSETKAAQVSADIVKKMKKISLILHEASLELSALFAPTLKKVTRSITKVTKNIKAAQQETELLFDKHAKKVEKVVHKVKAHVVKLEHQSQSASTLQEKELLFDSSTKKIKGSLKHAKKRILALVEKTVESLKKGAKKVQDSLDDAQEDVHLLFDSTHPVLKKKAHEIKKILKDVQGDVELLFDAKSHKLKAKAKRIALGVKKLKKHAEKVLNKPISLHEKKHGDEEHSLLFDEKQKVLKDYLKDKKLAGLGLFIHLLRGLGLQFHHRQTLYGPGIHGRITTTVITSAGPGAPVIEAVKRTRFFKRDTIEEPHRLMKRSTPTHLKKNITQLNVSYRSSSSCQKHLKVGETFTLFLRPIVSGTMVRYVVLGEKCDGVQHDVKKVHLAVSKQISNTTAQCLLPGVTIPSTSSKVATSVKSGSLSGHVTSQAVGLGSILLLALVL